MKCLAGWLNWAKTKLDSLLRLADPVLLQNFELRPHLIRKEGGCPGKKKEKFPGPIILQSLPLSWPHA